MKLAVPEGNMIRIITGLAGHDGNDAYVCLSENMSTDARILYEPTEICNNIDEYATKIVEAIKSRSIGTIGLEFDLVFPTANLSNLKEIGLYEKLKSQFKENNRIENDYSFFVKQVKRACAGDIDRLRKIDLPIAYGLLRVRLKGFEPEAPKMHIGVPQQTTRKYRETQYLSQLAQSKEKYLALVENACLYQIERELANDVVLEEYFDKQRAIKRIDGIIVQADEFFKSLNAALEKENLALMIGEEELTYEKYVLYILSGIREKSDVQLNQRTKHNQKQIIFAPANAMPLRRVAP